MTFEFDDNDLMECQEAYNALDPERRIAMSHFELAKETPITALELWIKFLKEPRVADSINEELALYKEAQQRKLIQRATQHDKSVGTAQMINALGKAMESNDNKSGTIMVYSYVPLNTREADSPNATAETHDIFDEQR